MNKPYGQHGCYLIEKIASKIWYGRVNSFDQVETVSIPKKAHGQKIDKVWMLLFGLLFGIFLLEWMLNEFASQSTIFSHVQDFSKSV